MNKSILVLDENSLVHGLVAAALDIDGLTLHHEFNPSRYAERVQETAPDLILLSNNDQRNDYAVCRKLRAISDVPLVLLANSSDAVPQQAINELHVSGVIRKPFEASDLQQQVSKHLDMIDLVGSAYEYRKSQSMREDDANPLAGIDVLDSDVLGMLQGGGMPDLESAEAVPDVDFSAELEDESAAAGSDAPLMMDAEELEDALHPENVFEAIDAPGGGLALAEEDALEAMSGMELEEEGELEELDAADLLEEESPGESAMPTGFDQSLQDEAPPPTLAGEPAARELGADGDEVQELTEADVLAEERPGESAAPSDFDVSLSEEAEPAELPPLDDVAMELGEADMDFSPAAPQAEAPEAEPFEARLDDDGGGLDLAGMDLEGMDEGALEEFDPEAELADLAGGVDEDEDEDVDTDIPPTVRRMMALKPVFSMTEDERARHLEEAESAAAPAAGEPSDDELERMAAELGGEDDLPDVPQDAVLDEDFGTLEPDEPLPDLDFDGVDDEKVNEALAADAALGLGEGEFAEPLEEGTVEMEDESSIGTLRAGAMDAGDALETAEAGDVEADEIAIDLDEESLIMSPLDEEVISEAAFSYRDSSEDTGDIPTLSQAEQDALTGGDDGGEDELSGIEAFREFPQMQNAEPLEIDVPGFAPAADATGPRDALEEDLDVLGLHEDEPFSLGGGARPAPGGDAPAGMAQDEAAADALTGLEMEEEPPFELSSEMVQDETEEDVPEEDLVIDDDQLAGEALSLDEEITEVQLSLEDEQLLGLEQETMDELQDLEASLAEIPEDVEVPEEFSTANQVEDLVEDEMMPLDDEDTLLGGGMADTALDKDEHDVSFEDDFAALRAEIEANPEGEKLSDLLREEGIAEAVADISFDLPQQEHAFTRVMGAEDMEEAGADAGNFATETRDDMAASFTDEVMAGLDMADMEPVPHGTGMHGALSGLDDQLRARLSAVLDEVITSSVRRAVQEEMPRLIEQLEKEQNHP